jgi:hypothetical protein
MGVTALYAVTGSGFLTGDGIRTEQWIVGGPRWDGGDFDGDSGTCSPLAGMKQVLSRGQPVGEPVSATTHFAIGGHCAFVLAAQDARQRDWAAQIGLTWLVTPGDPVSRHHLMLTSTFDLALWH